MEQGRRYTRYIRWQKSIPRLKKANGVATFVVDCILTIYQSLNSAVFKTYQSWEVLSTHEGKEDAHK